MYIVHLFRFVKIKITPSLIIIFCLKIKTQCLVWFIFLLPLVCPRSDILPVLLFRKTYGAIHDGKNSQHFHEILLQFGKVRRTRWRRCVVKWNFFLKIVTISRQLLVNVTSGPIFGKPKSSGSEHRKEKKNGHYWKYIF